MNLARQHFQKHSAKAAALSAAEFGTMQSQTAYEMQLMQLNQDRHRLRQIQSTEAKIKLKQGLVPTYLPYADGIMEANTGVQDEVFMTVLVWCIDTENYSKALEMAEFALRHNMIMPDRFERKTAVLVTEEIANAFLKVLKTNAAVDISVLQQLDSLVTPSDEEDPDIDPKVLDMPDQVKAKLFVALGKANIKLIQSTEQPSEQDLESAKSAQGYLSRAIELDDKCGGKQDLKTVETLLKKFTPPEPVQTNAGDSSPT
ncbi:terminase [Acinetobacter sp. AM]|uniref:phage terminase small subunit n=1 Tax=Acinetobacter sp. AM TaxID=2170730 RepID=UPI000DE6DDE7|nr:phage terminase small subunit [Acinetobacter sp. AM]PWB14241.1 terminase [Acinetobacter sp. AM]